MTPSSASLATTIPNCFAPGRSSARRRRTASENSDMSVPFSAPRCAVGGNTYRVVVKGHGLVLPPCSNGLRGQPPGSKLRICRSFHCVGKQKQVVIGFDFDFREEHLVTTDRSNDAFKPLANILHRNRKRLVLSKT